MPFIEEAKRITDIKCEKGSGIYLPHYPIKEVNWQFARCYEYEEIEEMRKQMELAKNKPFTRFEKPEGVELIDSVSKDNTIMICCKDLETARKLRTEVIKSLELLNFYIDQVEETGEIRYVR